MVVQTSGLQFGGSAPVLVRVLSLLTLPESARFSNMRRAEALSISLVLFCLLSCSDHTIQGLSPAGEHREKDHASIHGLPDLL